jgi:hypothetical protein
VSADPTPDPVEHEWGDPTKKHRHDIGRPDHGAVATESVTRTIQALLGLIIVASAALVIYTLAHAGFQTFEPGAADPVTESQPVAVD